MIIRPITHSVSAPYKKMLLAPEPLVGYWIYWKPESLPWLLQLLQNSETRFYWFFGVTLLIILMFVDPEMRKPKKGIKSNSKCRTFISELFLLLIAVSIIDVCINYTNFTGILTIDVLNWLKTADSFVILGQEIRLDGAI